MITLLMSSSAWVAINLRISMDAETGITVSRGTEAANMSTVKILAQESAHMRQGAQKQPT